MKSLTKEQTDLLLDVLHSEMASSRLKKELREADADMAKTAAGALDLLREKSAEVDRIRMASDTLLVERWLDLWRQWDGIASRLGESANTRATRDARDVREEASEFDARSLVQELESTAERMLVVMDEVFPLLDEPELFTLALDDLAGMISPHPDGMGEEEGAPFCLGKNVTRCVLQWQWLAHRREPSTGRRLVRAIYEIESDNAPIRLDPAETIDFLTELPDDVCGEIQALFRENSRGFDLDNPASIWSAIHREYEGRKNG